ncbi:16S rRNA (guanine(966)-N(2))-methyltransferase RsmD [Silvimonas sp.]|uniref:16S rRNA (guanine(966)-N(2))-methyltransferase RsmD n=1 Tax=Silvimonas sp. TaxID=2650811 RepID=UPI002843E387|nr:16S rRNA (guanine(966)-N(2))-methyltransferase RsmD [Silvimonas sp.]MDR3429778.1 16S rRNA (guanine(966)-N(2))-methyltransferase RsmD [Silvimonas sp.]
MAGQHKNQVRIIGGEYKRRMVHFPDGDGLRPTPDRVRETLFNWLGQDLTGQVCLDLFAGSGALGFEAASRNAKRVVMVEKAKPVYAALSDNHKTLGMTNVELIWSDAITWLKNASGKFDVVFLDPPFASDLLPQALELVAGLLNDDAVVYAECGQWPDLPGWEVTRELKAGAVRCGLLRRVG